MLCFGHAAAAPQCGAAMEFYAATKQGVIIYDALAVDKDPETEDKGSWRDWSKGQAADDISVKVVATIPSPPNAWCHKWSSDGSLFASVCDEGCRIFDVANKYKQVLEIPRVQPDVEGRLGGVRNLSISPLGSFIVIYEKWEPGHDNVHVWDMRPEHSGERLHDCLLKHYASGDLPVEMVVWTFDESTCLELVPEKGIRIRAGDLRDGEDAKMTFLPEKNASTFRVSPTATNDACYVSCYVPEADGMVARVVVYHLSNLALPTIQVNLPPSIKDCKMLWNAEGSALLVLASSDVDPTGASYFGTTYLYWLRADGKARTSEVYGAKHGLVNDVQWSPTKNEFMVIVGMLPATTRLHDGKTGKEVSTYGESRRNTLSWNPFGRFVAVGGFGTLPGDIDFFDRSCEETVASLRAELPVHYSWAPDGRHFLVACVAPRMNEGNQITIYTYSGEKLLKLDYKPENIEGRHEDTGAGARTKTQALLYAAGWKPIPAGKYEDKPASPRPAGSKPRKKGLPAGEAVKAGSGSAWKPRGAGGGDAGGSLVAAMMRGELDAPTTERTRDAGGWELNTAKPLEEWEIRKLEKERKKAEEKRIEEEKEQERQKIKDIEQGEKNDKKRLKELKKQLEEIAAAKDKEWDELTDEDEEMLEKEADIIEEIARLEKKL